MVYLYFFVAAIDRYTKRFFSLNTRTEKIPDSRTYSVPLTEDWGGPATVQLLKHIDELEAFINDPQAQNFNIQTDRDYLSMAPGLLIGASLAWGGLQALCSDDD